MQVQPTLFLNGIPGRPPARHRIHIPVTVTREYDAEGNLSKVTEAMPGAAGNRVTEILHDAVTDTTLGGSLRTVTKVNNITTSTVLRAGDGYGSRETSFGRETLTVREITGDGAWTVETTAPDSTVTLETHDSGRLDKTEFFKSTGTAPADLVSSTSYGYDALGRVTSVTDSRTGTTSFTMDGAGDPVAHGTAGAVPAYTDSGNLLAVLDPGDRGTTHAYDQMGRRIKTEAPATDHANITHTSHTPRGEVRAVWGDNTYPTFRVYDEQGRMTELHTWQSAPALTHETVTPPDDSAVTEWQYHSARGWLIRKEYHDGKGTDYTYTAAGRLSTRKWARTGTGGNRILTTYGYDQGILETVTYTNCPVGTPNLAYIHDNFGRIHKVYRGTDLSTLDPAELHAEYTYDPTTLRLALEKQTLDFFGRHLHRHHDPIGRPLSLELTRTDGTSEYTTGYGYDNAGRLQNVWHHPALDATTKAPTGNPTFTYGYTYTQSNPGDPRVGATTGPNLKQDIMPYTVTRNAVGGDPALTANRTYDGTRDTLLTIENKAGTSVVSSYTYDVNPLGQRDSVTTTGSVFSSVQADWDWEYDSLGQLVVADSPTAARDRAYQYDTIGNREKFAHGTTALPQNNNYAADALNQYNQVPDYTPQPAHDDDGNLTRGPVPGTGGYSAGIQPPADASLIEWDAENRLVSCKIGSTTYSYEYDHLSRLITRRVNGSISRRYYYDGWNRIAEFIHSTYLVDTFTWGLDLSGTMRGAGGVGGLLATRWVDVEGSPDYFPAYDGNGNVTEYLRTTGAVESHYEYDPFGTLTRRTGNISARFQYRFSTKPRDFSVGLYYYGYRYMDPVTGRWPSRDPIEEEGGLNLHGFVGNKPTSKVDRLGMLTLDEFLDFLGEYSDFFDNLSADYEQILIEDPSKTTIFYYDCVCRATLKEVPGYTGECPDRITGRANSFWRNSQKHINLEGFDVLKRWIQREIIERPNTRAIITKLGKDAERATTERADKLLQQQVDPKCCEIDFKFCRCEVKSKVWASPPAHWLHGGGGLTDEVFPQPAHQPGNQDEF